MQGTRSRSASGHAKPPGAFCDEVGYIPFDQDAANRFFQLVASRYEHASLIMTSNLSFGLWGDVFGDPTVASAMIDRIVHHADVISLEGASYWLKNHQPAPQYGIVETTRIVALFWVRG